MLETVFMAVSTHLCQDLQVKADKIRHKDFCANEFNTSVLQIEGK